MNTRPIRSRLGRGLAVVVAGTVVGVTGAFVVAADERSADSNDHHQADLEAIAEWARANDFSGGSPASLAKVDLDLQARAEMAAEYEAIAEWARDNGMTGLSPAWMQPIETEIPARVVTLDARLWPRR